MGQQQLLLVILVTIIVGIATVVAINTFGTAADSANVDAVRQDIAQIAAASQGYFLKPAMLGGGSRSFNNINFDQFAFAGTVHTNPLIAYNENGTYQITVAGTDSEELTIEAWPASNDGYGTPPTVAGPSLEATARANELVWVRNTPGSTELAGSEDQNTDND